MARFEAFARDIQIATEGMSAEAIARELAKFAVQGRDEAIRSGQASPIYETYVNGRLGADERSVIAPGPILYVFSYWSEVLTFALAHLKANSPVRSGRYRDSHQVLVNMQPVTDFTTISGEDEVIITNRQPYTRKIESGAMVMQVPPGIYEGGMKAVRTKYGRYIMVRTRFIDLPNPYILREDGGRRGRRRGDPLTYPSLILNVKH